MVTVLWVASAIAVVTAAIRSRRHASAVRMGRLGVGFLFIVAGAAMNGWFLMRGDDYGKFASGSYIPFVRDTWQSVVVPNHELWIGMLIAFELAIGVLSLAGERHTQLAYALAIVFHVCLLSFGWGFYLWSIPMVVALATLLAVERRTGPTHRAVTGPEPTARALINVLPKT